MNATIVPLEESHFESPHRALDTVAREKRFLAFTQAPPPDQAFAFYRNILENNLCQFVAVLDGEVVGWCDILPTHGEARAHIGHLGLALIPQARRQGLGRRLMEAAIARAWEKGLTRIELTVRTDNLPAKALYDCMGFQTEGIHRRSFCVDGEYFDAYAMALLRSED